MRFSVSFLLASILWVVVLLVSINATMHSPRFREGESATVVGFLSVVWLSVAVVAYFEDRKESRAYWRGFFVVGLSMLLFVSFFATNVSKEELFVGVMSWAFHKYRDVTGVPPGNLSSDRYIIALCNSANYWSVPVLGHFGGQIGMWFNRRALKSEGGGG